MLAAVGLGRDSSPTIVASMLISPIMGPILAVAVSYNLRKPKLLRLGLYNYMLTVFICVTIGFAVRTSRALLVRVACALSELRSRLAQAQYSLHTFHRAWSHARPARDMFRARCRDSQRLLRCRRAWSPCPGSAILLTGRRKR